MARTPTALCRFDLALRAVMHVEPRAFVEIGCGSGEFLFELGMRGWTGVGVDASHQAVQAASSLLRRRNIDGIDAICGTLEQTTGAYQAAFCFEVLEHLEDDVAALQQIRDLLNPGGVLVLSVPAHMRKWTPTDTLAGHVRRYERYELESKLKAAGFTETRISSMAVPFANMTRPALDALSRSRLRRVTALSRDERTLESGVHRAPFFSETQYRILFNRATMWPVLAMQRAFASSDFGRNYVVCARRSAD